MLVFEIWKKSNYKMNSFREKKIFLEQENILAFPALVSMAYSLFPQPLQPVQPLQEDICSSCGYV